MNVAPRPQGQAGPPTPSRRAAWPRRVLWAAALVLPLAVVYLAWGTLTTRLMLGTQHLLDLHDIGVYFEESGWIVGLGSLYGTIPSEYPLGANLVFAVVRVASLPLAQVLAPETAYAMTWVAVAWAAFLASVWYTVPRTQPRTIALWLSPAVVYFAVTRFDLYPTMAVFLALLAARRGRDLEASAWMGVALALKGFALYALPAFLVWVWLRQGARRTIPAAALAVGPFAASLLIVLVLGGPDAMLMPFRFQADRLPNGQGTWDIIHLVLRIDAARWITRHTYMIQILAIAGALLAAATRPRTPEALARAFVLGIGAFVTASIFYSPQYVLWFVPMAAVADGWWLFGSVVALGWVTIAYYPIVYASRRYRLAYQATLVVTTAVRTLAIVAALPWPLPGDRRGAPTVRRLGVDAGATPSPDRSG